MIQQKTRANANPDVYSRKNTARTGERFTSFLNFLKITQRLLSSTVDDAVPETQVNTPPGLSSCRACLHSGMFCCACIEQLQWHTGKRSSPWRSKQTAAVCVCVCTKQLVNDHGGTDGHNRYRPSPALQCSPCSPIVYTANYYERVLTPSWRYTGK